MVAPRTAASLPPERRQYRRMDEPKRDDKWLLFWRFLGRYGLSGAAAVFFVWWTTMGTAGDLKAIRDTSAETLRVVKETQNEARASQAKAENAAALNQKLLIKICQNTARTDAAREACD